jgi:hypothetical protein
MQICIKFRRLALASLSLVFFLLVLVHFTLLGALGIVRFYRR